MGKPIRGTRKRKRVSRVGDDSTLSITYCCALNIITPGISCIGCFCVRRRDTASMSPWYWSSWYCWFYLPGMCASCIPAATTGICLLSLLPLGASRSFFHVLEGYFWFCFAIDCCCCCCSGYCTRLYYSGPYESPNWLYDCTIICSSDHIINRYSCSRTAPLFSSPPSSQPVLHTVRFCILYIIIDLLFLIFNNISIHEKSGLNLSVCSLPVQLSCSVFSAPEVQAAETVEPWNGL